MKWWWLLVIFIVGVIQMTLLKYFEIGNVVPNVLLVLALIFMLFSDFNRIWLYLIFIGIILDLFSNFYFGTSLVSLVITAAILDLIIKNFFNQKSILAVLLLGFFVLFFYYLILAGVNGIFTLSSFFPPKSFAYLTWPFFLTGIIYDFSIFILIFTLSRQFKLTNED